MPLTTDRSNITSQSGNISQVLIAEQRQGYSTPITVSPPANTPVLTTANGFYKFQPRINSADLAREGTTLPTVFLDGSASQTADAPGRVDITNGLTFGLSVNGTALFLRMLTQDPNPTYNIYGGSGTTLPVEQTVVANTTRLSDTSAAATVNFTEPTSPVQLHVTISSSATIAAGGRGTITLSGVDDEGTAISEVLSWTNPISARAVNSRLWYKSGVTVSSAGWESASGKQYGVTAQDKSVEVIFTPTDDQLRAFWTAEVTKGITPNVYNGLVMQNAVITLGADALVDFACTFLGRQGQLYTNVSGATYAENEAANGTDNRATKSTRGTGSTGLLEASPQVYASWQSKLTAESDLEMAIQDGTFTINQELEYVNTLGDRFQATQPARSTKRLVQTEGTVVYAPQNNYSTYFESNQPITNVNLGWKQSGYGVYPAQLDIEMPECQLTADPDPAVADAGTISQTVTMKAVKSEALNYEYRIRARYSEYPVLPDLR